jgi:hypothetical protein
LSRPNYKTRGLTWALVFYETAILADFFTNSQKCMSTKPHYSFYKLMSLDHIARQFNLPDFTSYLLQIVPSMPKSQTSFLSFRTLISCCGKEKLISNGLHNL